MQLVLGVPNSEVFKRFIVVSIQTAGLSVLGGIIGWFISRNIYSAYAAMLLLSSLGAIGGFASHWRRISLKCALVLLLVYAYIHGPLNIAVFQWMRVQPHHGAPS